LLLGVANHLRLSNRLHLLGNSRSQLLRSSNNSNRGVEAMESVETTTSLGITGSRAEITLVVLGHVLHRSLVLTDRTKREGIGDNTKIAGIIVGTIVEITTEGSRIVAMITITRTGRGVRYCP
jgi:hypothetical protein